MGMMTTIPVRLTLEESSAVALTTAAKHLDAAHDADDFAAALDNNHRLWLLLCEIADTSGWAATDRRLTDFVMTTSRKAGRGVDDDHIEALIDINRSVSARLTGGRDLSAIQRRAMLAWQESGWVQSLERWLLAEIQRKARMH